MNVLEKYDPELRQSMALLHKARDEIALSQPQDVASLRVNTEPMRLRLQAMPSSKQVEAQSCTTKTIDGFDLEMIWYEPLDRASDPHSSAVLHIHGGGLITYDVYAYRAIVSDLVARSQILMLSVNYRLAPENPFPTPLEDCWTALLWLHHNSERLGVDQSRIQVYGDSAGGGLAAALSILARDRCLTPPLAKQVLIYPMLDDRTSMQATNIDLLPLATAVHRWFLSRAERDPRQVRTGTYITAQLLHAIHGFSCGSKRFYEIAERDRSCLINNARCAGLFARQNGECPPGASLDLRWRTWLRAESLKRLAWAVYDHDAASATMRDDRPFISLNEIKMELPSRTSLWEAETAEAWAAILRHGKDGALREWDFGTCLDGLLGNADETIASLEQDFQTSLLLHTLARMMWTHKEMTTQPGAKHLASYLPVQQGEDDLLHLVDRLAHSRRLSVSITMAPSKFATCIHQLCICQLTHIIAGEDMWDYLHLIWRKHPQAEAARTHILSFIRRRPQATRAFQVANARLLSIIRLHPSNHPQEPYNTFHAGMAVWVMATLMRQQETAVAHGPARPNKPPCHIDWFGEDDDPESSNLREWLEHGSRRRTPRMHGVPDLTAHDGPELVLRQTVEVLGRMSVWGVAKTLLNATLRVLHSL
ncbi:hypothetical protein M409DRAFT_57788 [Zasmidium cellare ATCC 36951]|uniref:Alpha/beta hydrolase fold-3 domain-containing protein n=1 Tax=Zasmidium cellare ATCC 36951 TaxID=1080233 RepID=A0A6A6CA64_ZASCE|nr:uncharacterized protein M409DRAFT_57788 [Zasmidium cellare ATCC 36951]KAF2163120.1 hypothetical protein M409DRAFT_57788 [Zasmidium cellare ATCC 36951]